MATITYRNFQLEIEDPVIVSQTGTYEDLGWGPWQFPGLFATDKGNILCTWNVGVDSVAGYEESLDGHLFGGMVTEDGGKTWRKRLLSDREKGPLMSNGKEYFCADMHNAFVPSWLEKYTPAMVGKQSGTAVYAPGSVPEYSQVLRPKEYDPETGLTTEFEAKVNWPHHGMHCCNHEGVLHVYPFENLMGHLGYTLPDGEGGLFLFNYSYGYSAQTGILHTADAYNVYVFHSGDCGRTWNWISEVLTTDDYFINDPHWEGFCEPGACKMPDGSYVMLMRTGGGLPSYLTRSTDNCRTWSKPVVFDWVGVFPRIMTLGCGVTLSAYGRPGVFLRATDDPSGLSWETPVDLDVGSDTGRNASELITCSYTALYPLSDTDALLVYSHYKYPNADGIPVKTILSRRIHIKK